MPRKTGRFDELLLQGGVRIGLSLPTAAFWDVRLTIAGTEGDPTLLWRCFAWGPYLFQARGALTMAMSEHSNERQGELGDVDVTIDITIIKQVMCSHRVFAQNGI